MNYKYSVISLIIICLGILIFQCMYSDLNIVKENFITLEEKASMGYVSNSDTNSVSSNSYNDNENEKLDYRPKNAHMNSIVAKYSGKVLNIIPLNNPPTQKCIIPFFNKRIEKCVSVNDDGTYSLSIPNRNSIRQQFLIIHIKNAEDYENHIGLINSNLGYNLEDAKYPFYILKSLKKPNMALQYQDGNVSVRPLANYDSQKWDLSLDKIERMIGAHEREYDSRLTGDVRSDPEKLGTNEYSNNEKIKIKLNLDNQVLNTFLKQNLGKIITNNNDSDNESEIDVNGGLIDLGNCDGDGEDENSVPKNSVRSLCRGCNPDLINPE